MSHARDSKSLRYARHALAVLLFAVTAAAASTGERIVALTLPLALFSLLALLMRSGWMPFCILAGAVLGLLSDPAVKAGPQLAQVEQSVRCVAAGLLLGMLAGVFLEIATPRSPR